MVKQKVKGLINSRAETPVKSSKSSSDTAQCHRKPTTTNINILFTWLSAIVISIKNM